MRDTSNVALSFVHVNIISTLDSWKYIVSDNTRCLGASAVQNFMNNNAIEWKTALHYTPMISCQVERIVWTIKQNIQQTIFNHRNRWPAQPRFIQISPSRLNRLAISIFFHVRRPTATLTSRFAATFEKAYGAIPAVSESSGCLLTKIKREDKNKQRKQHEQQSFLLWYLWNGLLRDRKSSSNYQTTGIWSFVV